MSPHSPRPRVESDTEIGRELEVVSQAMESVTTQDDLADFLNNPENAQRVNDLVEDIRDALMDYQVCILEHPAHTMANTGFRLRYDEISTTRVVERS